MRNNERQEQIMDILNQRGSVTVSYLVKTLFSSPATIRRDLTSMEMDGFIKRTHGGAMLLKTNSEETSINVREEMNRKEKKSIAFRCLDLIKDNSSLFLDSSSTVSNLIPFLNQKKGLMIITNGLSAAALISARTSFRVFVPGGYINASSNSILGETAIHDLNGFFCDYAIFSAAALSKEGLLTEASLEQADLKKMMMNHAKNRILLLDSTKFNKTMLAVSSSLSDVDILITDKKPEPSYLDLLKEKNVELIIA